MSRLTAPSTLSKRQPLHPQASYPYASGSSSPYPYQSSANNASSSYVSLSSAGRASPYYDASSRPSSSMGAVHGSSSLPQYSKARTAEDLEEQGDERLAGLMGKVRILKDITSGIGTEIKDGNLEMTTMNDAFASTSHVLRGTMRRMTTMAKNQGGRWCWFMLFILLCVWFFVIMWWFRR